MQVSDSFFMCVRIAVNDFVFQSHTCCAPQATSRRLASYTRLFTRLIPLHGRRYDAHPIVQSALSLLPALPAPDTICALKPRNVCVTGGTMGQSHVFVQLIHGFCGLHAVRAAMPHPHAPTSLGLHIHVNYSQFCAPNVSTMRNVLLGQGLLTASSNNHV